MAITKVRGGLMAFNAATIVVHEAGYIEHIQLDTEDSDAWLRATLSAATLADIALGPQMRLYFDPHATGPVNPVAERVLRAYPAEPAEIRGAVAICRYDQRERTVHDLFVAQMDRVTERFCEGLPLGKPAASSSGDAESTESAADRELCSLLIPPVGTLAIVEPVEMPTVAVEQWISVRLGKPYDAVEHRLLAPGMLLLFGRGAGATNFTATDICTMFSPLRRTYVHGPALVCRRDDVTGQFGDLRSDQLRDLMDRYSALKGPLGELVQQAYLESIMRPTNHYVGTTGVSFGTEKLGFQFDTDDEEPH